MKICEEDKKQYEASDYCTICSYRRENELLKEQIVALNQEIIKLNSNQNHG